MDKAKATRLRQR